MVKKINEFKNLQKKKGKKGFSMIELIIVIAIMAILVALIGTQLIPYLEKSREKRDGTTLDTCLTALESVIADNEGVTINNNDTISDILSSIGGTATTDFETYAGLAVSDTPFKSDNAGGNSTTVGNVTIQVNSSNVITGATAGNGQTPVTITRN